MSIRLKLLEAPAVALWVYIELEIDIENPRCCPYFLHAGDFQMVRGNHWFA